MHVLVYGVLVVEQSGLHVADLFSLLAVEDVALCNVRIARLDEHILDAVLYRLDRYLSVLYLGLIVCRYLQCEKVYDVVVVLLFECVERLPDCRADLGEVEIYDSAVTLDDLIHFILSLSYKDDILFVGCRHAPPRAASAAEFT